MTTKTYITCDLLTVFQPIGEMDLVFLTFIIVIASGSATLNFSLTENDRTQPWEMALNYCKSIGARLPIKTDLNQLINTSPNVSKESFWLGSYKARTDFLTDLGCYHLQEESIKLSTIWDENINGPLCFNYCIKYKNVATNLIALQGIKCLCILDKELPEGATFTIGCNILCSDGSVCGGNKSFSVYRIEHSLKYRPSAGFCVAVTYPFDHMKIMSCHRKNNFYCKGKLYKDAEIKVSRPLHRGDWKEATFICANKSDSASKFSQVEIADFSENRIKDYSKNETYWVSTRVYTTKVAASDILVDPKYIYLCYVWSGQHEKRIGCTKRKKKVKCIKDLQAKESSQPLNPELPALSMISDITSPSDKETEAEVNITVGIIVPGAVILAFGIILIIVVSRRKSFSKKTESSTRTTESNITHMMTSNSTMRHSKMRCTDTDNNYENSQDELEDIISRKNNFKNEFDKENAKANVPPNYLLPKTGNVSDDHKELSDDYTMLFAS